ncbi:hypothetical protein Aduo_001525 [Ancylostoma duodenale]
MQLSSTPPACCRLILEMDSDVSLCLQVPSAAHLLSLWTVIDDGCSQMLYSTVSLSHDSTTSERTQRHPAVDGQYLIGAFKLSTPYRHALKITTRKTKAVHPADEFALWRKLLSNWWWFRGNGTAFIPGLARSAP